MAERCQCYHDGRFTWFLCPRDAEAVREADGRHVCAECVGCDVSRQPGHQQALDAASRP